MWAHPWRPVVKAAKQELRDGTPSSMPARDLVPVVATVAGCGYVLLVTEPTFRL